jgi:peptidyl-prolyl cis-trans isomerase D
MRLSFIRLHLPTLRGRRRSWSLWGSNMLQNIRDNSQGWIAKGIIGVIVVLLSFTGFDAITNFASKRDHAAEVNGQVISKSELDTAVELQRRQLLQQLGADFDESLIDDKLLRESSLRGLIDREVLLQGVRDAGFRFSDAEMDKLLLTTPEFQQNGQFSSARFDQFVRARGMNRVQFRKALAEEILIGQLRAGISGSGFVTDDEIEAFVRLERQTRDFATQQVEVQAGDVQISDAEVKAFYDENPADFMTAEQVVIDYIELKKERFFDEVEVDDDKLQSLYQREIGNLAEQRRGAHILIETSDSVDAAQARARIEEIKQQLEAGADFAELAKQFSQDPGSKDDGGDLGFAGPGVYEPAFEEALYALKVGEVSAPVQTEYGFHLIKLLEQQAPEVPSFDSLKGKLTAELKAEQVERKFVDASKALADAAFEASDLSQPAQDLGLQIQTSSAFGRNGGAEGIIANRQVVAAAYSAEVLDDGANSSIIELDPNTAVVLRLKEHLKPQQLALEQVADSIRQELLAQRANEQAKERGEALLRALQAGEAAELPGAWAEVEAASRQQEGVAPEVLQALFRMPRPHADGKPVYAGVAHGTGRYTVIRLDGVSDPTTELSAEEKVQYRNFLASRDGDQDYQAFRELLKNKADVERY